MCCVSVSVCVCVQSSNKNMENNNSADYTFEIFLGNFVKCIFPSFFYIINLQPRRAPPNTIYFCY